MALPADRTEAEIDRQKIDLETETEMCRLYNLPFTKLPKFEP
jgi:hypothetical protein